MNKKPKLKNMLMMMTAAVLVLTTACSSGANNNAVKDEGNGTPAEAVKLTQDDKGWEVDKSPITFDWYINFSWFPNKWGVDATSKYITDKTGVNINFIVPAGNEAEKMNTMMASGSLPDFITLGWSEEAVKKMIEGDLVLPLNELADQYDPYFYKVTDPAKLSWYTQENGNVYGYPNSSSSPKDYEKLGDNITSSQTFLVRKDMYEALGSPDMRTPEGFLKALADAKKMYPDVNGQPLIPLGMYDFNDTGNASLQHYIQNFLAVPYDKDGQLYDRDTDAEYVKWLKTMRQANENGLLSKDVFIDKRPQMEEKIAQGRYFAMLYARTDLANQQNALYANDPNSIYVAVDGPANANLDQPTLAGPSISGWTVTLISKNVKDKARAIRFLDYLISEEGQHDTFFGEKGTAWDTIDGKDQFLPEVLNQLNTDRGAFDKQIGASHTFWMMMDTNLTPIWSPAAVEPFKQLEDWTRGKSKSLSEFDQLNPTGTSEEGIMNTKIGQEFGKVLPKLLLAKTEADFDKIWDAYMIKREDLGFSKVQAFKQKKYEENVAKLAAATK
ncbi:ABC transporter substrate-binding protein [Paenibacillus sp. FSL H8-0548]|uniref:extracellular solute-binding protein n=1 Tax=Paenibacillus sp. FSL H8-0548 TaxID=1920422 RepID=UPI00096D722D|nr:extracellular solute-binding protein [Paenibacillus sp. FSL H8-0548]OMF37732.1 ABC transporter substrate-binding protein [Paenibacillus sp. FSL H8-0548]